MSHWQTYQVEERSYTLDVKGAAVAGDDEESSPKLNTATKKQRLLIQAIETVQYLEQIINTDPTAGTRLKEEVNGKTFKDSLKEMTEFVQEKKRGGENVDAIDVEGQRTDEVCHALYSPSVKSKVAAYETKLDSVKGRLIYSSSKPKTQRVIDIDSDNTEGSESIDTAELESEENDDGKNNEDGDGKNDHIDSAGTSPEYKISNTQGKNEIKNTYYVDKNADLHWDGIVVSRSFLEGKYKTNIDEDVDDKTKRHLLQKYMLSSVNAKEAYQIWSHYQPEAASQYSNSHNGRKPTKAYMVAELADFWSFTVS